MQRWIKDLFRSLTRLVNPIGTAFVVVRGVILAMWGAWADAAKQARRRQTMMNKAIAALSQSIRVFSRAIAGQFKATRSAMVAFTRAKVTQIKRDLRSYVDTRVVTLLNFIGHNHRDSLRRDANLAKDIRDNRRWTAQRLSDVHNKINDLTRNLRHVLAGPRVLAHWLVDAMVAETLAWLKRNERRIGAWMLAAIVPATVALALRIERLLGRLI